MDERRRPPDRPWTDQARDDYAKAEREAIQSIEREADRAWREADRAKIPKQARFAI